ncbi:MAG: hypothetical protein DWQ34_23550 [Planctomycetota bacterium]|nr:MAG: hypothetical protein DWQ29_17735 [Planctomycetota bacterium]REJ87915.1 MAG: hypothetical protein DWQ34_23550 [Planctomycetota bacterium]REK23253.1 MAG: hypothetical protein DWQ41_17675 [Planctomycetota bacterium]REK30826.1 MAG: hypothetical protein DWQ45_20510 [Planctomycetota bacterium]
MPRYNCPEDGFDLRQCYEFEYILIGDLRDLLEDPFDDENRRWLVAVVDALLETLPREFELKSQEGYLADVLEEFPNWDSEVARLEQQYAVLCSRLAQLRERIMSRNPLQEISERLKIELEAWMDAFARLHRDEQQLVLSAANLEVGAGD